MYNIIILAVISFFAAFGLMELTRFIYSQWRCGGEVYYVLAPVKNRQEDIECVVRGIMLKTENAPVITVDMGSGDSTLGILRCLEQRYANLRVFTYEEYMEFLKETVEIYGKQC